MNMYWEQIITNFLRWKTTRSCWCFCFTLSQPSFEVLNLLPIALDECICVNNLSLLGVELSCIESSAMHNIAIASIFTWTHLIRFANCSVLILSLTAPGSGLIVQITLIRAFPDNDGWSIRVSLELRKGTWSLKSKHSAKRSSSRKENLLLAFGCVICQSPNDRPKGKQTRRKVRDDIDCNAKIHALY